MNDPISVLRLPEVERRTGLTRPTIYRKAKDGSFPRPIRLGGNSSGWVESEVNDWLSNLIAARDASEQVPA